MRMELLLQIHLFAVAFWLGVVAVEYLLEKSRAQSRAQGFTVAQLHRRIDLYFELPAFSVVLISGLMMFEPDRFDGIYALKIVAGLVAVLGNTLCLIPVLQRRTAAAADNLSCVIQLSRQIDLISLVAIPVGLVTLVCGLYLMMVR
jgi:hypothetical protein